MAKSRGGDSPDISEVRVKLKPLFGIPPTTYMPVLLGFVVVLILFFLLLYPGITKPGSVVEISSRPTGASVYIDDVRIGATPLSHFISAGQHSLTVKRRFFGTEQHSIEVPSRLFGSLFFPRVLRVDTSLSLSEPDELREQAAREFARWALVGQANARYQFPPVLADATRAVYSQAAGTAAREGETGVREGAREGAAGEKGDGDEEETGAAAADAQPGAMRELLEHALADVRSESLLKDYLRAGLLDSSAAQAPSGYHIGALLVDFVERLEAEPGLPFLLETALPDEVGEEMRANGWFQDYTGRYTTRLLPHTDEGDPIAAAGERRLVNGVAFRRLPGRTYVMGMRNGGGQSLVTERLDVPHLETVDSFYMMETEVTEDLFARFLASVPEWRPSARSRLSARGLVTEDYLAGWEDYESGFGSDLPVTNVSHFAASRFASWFTNRLGEPFADYEARLPTEAEWEWAAYANAERGAARVFEATATSGPLPVASTARGAAGLYDLLGNVWEWQTNWYHPAVYPLRSPGESWSDELPGAHRAVRGGAWTNRSDQIDIVTRGSQPPSWCTPFLGFRLVLVPAGSD